MSSKIEKLTPQQEKDLVAFYNENLEIGRSLTPIDHDKAEKIISKFYQRIKQAAPKFLYYRGPHEIIKAHPEVELSHYFAGQQWVYWKTLYKFAEKIGTKFAEQDSVLLDEWYEECKNLHWWFPYENYCLISERPIRLTVNGGGFLHNEKHMAIEYADGWGMFYLNGVKVPEYLVTTAEEDLDINLYFKEANADVKAEFVRKFGVERMLHLGKKIDSYENYDQEEQPFWWSSEYELWDMAALFTGLDYQPYLKMVNGTTGIWHVEALSPSVRNLKEALKERFGGKDMKIIGLK